MAKTISDFGMTPLGAEREKLDKLMKFFDNGTGIKFKDAKRRVGFIDVDDTDDAPKLTQRVKTFYVESWPEVIVKKDNTIRPRSSRNLGGTPITVQTALAVRELLFGSHVHSFSREWRKSCIMFQDMSNPCAWGLQTQRCGSRGLLMCINANVVKHLVFEREYVSSILAQNALKPNEFERRRALINAMTEILWITGDKRRCCVCLLQDERSYPLDYRIRDDGVTEKIVLFEFKKYSDLQIFLRRNLEDFSHDKFPGCILFLYSVILSATIYKLKEEMQVTESNRRKLLTDNQDCSQALINLLLTGHAVHYVHNGNMIYDSDGKLFKQDDVPTPIKGIRQRSDIGYLFWDKGESDDDRTEVGSMLKTPKRPIWVSNTNGQIGLLFSTNLDLVSDWRVENRFHLHYYTGLACHPPCTLHVETRFGRNALGRTRLVRRDEEEKIPQLERCIMTKWFGAAIDWPGIPPFF